MSRTLVRYWGSSFKSPREGTRVASYFGGVVAAGWRCHLVCSREPADPSWAAPVTALGVSIEYLPRARGNFDPACVAATRALCRRTRADVLHCDNTHTSPLLGAWLAGVPVRLWSKHAMEPAFEQVRRAGARERFAPSLHLSARLATRILPVSRAIAGELESLGVPARKIVVVPLPPGDGRARSLDRAAARAGVGLAAGEICFVTIGRAVPVKGWDVLLEAFAGARRAIPHARLLLVGSTDAPDEKAFAAQLRARAASLGCAGALTWTGHLADIAPALCAADVFVLPSRSEGYSLALLEALGAGLPVVSTRVGVATDVIRHQQNGWLVEREDARSLAAALEAVGTDPALRARLAMPVGAALPGIPREDEHGRTLLALYESLLSAPPRGDLRPA